MRGGTDARKQGRMDAWKWGCKRARMRGQLNSRTYRCTDAWMCGFTDVRRRACTEAQRHGHMNTQTHGCMDARMRGRTQAHARQARTHHTCRYWFMHHKDAHDTHMQCICTLLAYASGRTYAHAHADAHTYATQLYHDSISCRMFC